MKACEITRAFEQIAPLDSGVPGDELGFVWGNPETKVSGAGCMWCVHTQSIQYCAACRIDEAQTGTATGQIRLPVGARQFREALVRTPSRYPHLSSQAAET